MNELLKNKESQKRLLDEGYVLIDFISREKVDLIKEYYLQNLESDSDSGFKVGLDHMDKSLVKETMEFLTGTLKGTADEQFIKPQIFTASYVVKHPGNDAMVPPHQDWTFTDESQFASYTVWIPLIDTTIENGALCVIPGSHRFFDHPRSSPSPQSKSALADHMFTLFPYVKPIPMKAGQALIFNNRTIHASPPNVSDQPRLAVGIGVTQQDAPLWHYYESPQNSGTLHRYEVNDDFFIHYSNSTLSSRFENGELLTELKQLGTEQRKVHELSGVEIESKIRSVEGNEWQQQVVEAIAPLSELYQKPKAMSTETSQSQNKEDKKETHVEEPTKWVDDRTFFQKYTISNIIAEIKWRLNGRK